MKVFTQKYGKRCLLFALLIALTQCIGLDGVEQPENGVAGEEITVIIRPKIEPHPQAGVESNVRLVIGFLAPRAWAAAQNTTMAYTSNRGNGTMSLVPAGRRPAQSNLEWPAAIRDKAGIGGNLIDDLEWVVFWTDQTYNVGGGSPVINVEVTMKTRLGTQNMIVQLGYFVATTAAGLPLNNANNWKVEFPEPFEVTGGEEPLQNFTSPQLATISPLRNMDNDLITITFDASVVDTDLDGADEVFLCATGYTQDDTPIEVCEQTEKSAMTAINDVLWEIDLWPREYFGLTDGQSLQRMQFTFTNRQGDISVVDVGSGEPFVHVFRCE